MSIFDELNIDDPSIPDPTAGLPAGQYKAFLFECKVVPNKNDSAKRNVEFTYKVSEGDHKGSTIKEWKSANKDDEPKTKGWLKLRLESLGRKDGQGPGDLVGTPVVIKVVQNGTFTNVNEVIRLNADGTVPTAGATATAAASSGPDW